MKPKAEDVGFNIKCNSQLDSDTLSRPISYHLGLSDNFEAWVANCGIHPETLRQLTESRIRSHHHEAFRRDACYRHRPDDADIFCLSLGTVDVFYSVEPDGVLVRGYNWDFCEPVDEQDGGGFYVN